MEPCERDAEGIMVGLFGEDNVEVRLGGLSDRVVWGLFCCWEERAQ